MWNGTALALNPSATTISAMAATSSGWSSRPSTLPSRSAMPASDVVPVTP